MSHDAGVRTILVLDFFTWKQVRLPAFDKRPYQKCLQE